MICKCPQPVPGVFSPSLGSRNCREPKAQAESGGNRYRMSPSLLTPVAQHGTPPLTCLTLPQVLRCANSYNKMHFQGSWVQVSAIQIAGREPDVPGRIHVIERASHKCGIDTIPDKRLPLLGRHDPLSTNRLTTAEAT